ncbi:MAG: non-canonical purine pyrophosphatase [Solirubrobacterales bacterium]|jgi:XTP/dITP diphosphohydrolase|nr:non-canonical purine pyrophosphatase [Solirubrobacterales bacterium]
MRLVLATRNAHKVEEFGLMLAEHELEGLPDHLPSPEETGSTFAENALIKAHAAADALGVPVIADDSGVQSAALGGAPGVRSARFAGEDATDEDNLRKLLHEAPAGDALAYVCVIAFVDPARGEAWTVEGRCTGTLDPHPRGSNGFGYDPAFLPDEVADLHRPGRTMAELEPAEKARISHRAHAVDLLRERLAGRA